MKTALTFAVLGVLVAASPVLATGSDQSSDSGYGGSSSSSDQSGMSGKSGKSGMSGKSSQQSQNQDTIRNAQQALDQQGYQIGQADGKIGPKTSQAIRQFQRDQGLNSNGQLDQDTLAALGVEGSPQQAQTPDSGGPSRAHRGGMHPMTQGQQGQGQQQGQGGADQGTGGGGAPGGGSMGGGGMNQDTGGGSQGGGSGGTSGSMGR